MNRKTIYRVRQKYWGWLDLTVHKGVVHKMTSKALHLHTLQDPLVHKRVPSSIRLKRGQAESPTITEILTKEKKVKN